VDAAGHVDLPLVGRIRAGGLSVEQFKADLILKLRKQVREPQVSVSMVESRSQPISVLGAVNNAGVHQLNGRKSLVEVIAIAGGLRPDAGHSIKITRQLQWGSIPIPNAVEDAKANVSVAEVKVKSILQANDLSENITIMPNDVISVSRAEMVYVIGEIAKPGGFVLNEREDVSVLQALSLAGGLKATAAGRQARILRGGKEGLRRTELPVDVKRILAGKAKDVPMLADDILFVPNSTSKTISLRAIETGISIGSGILVWRR
jgi:polysaccharide export outer membrane protein